MAKKQNLLEDLEDIAMQTKSNHQINQETVKIINILTNKIITDIEIVKNLVELNNLQSDVILTLCRAFGVESEENTGV